MYYEEDNNEQESMPQSEDALSLMETKELLEADLKEKQDAFLDSYHKYLQNKKSSMHKNILERKVIELELVDPNFTFFID